MTLRDDFLRFASAHGTLAHIEHLLSLLPHASETVLAAVWFHDVIYDGARNEERSAELAREALRELRCPAEEIAVFAILRCAQDDGRRHRVVSDPVGAIVSPV